MSMDRIIREEVRLIILRELASQTSGSLTSTALRTRLAEMFLIDKDRSWVEQEIAYLGEYGAVTVTQAGSVVIATITDHGENHIARRTIIPGVLKPSRRPEL